MTWNQRRNWSWAKFLQSDEQRTQWTAIQMRRSFTVMLMSLSDFFSSILQFAYIKAIFKILSCKLHVLSDFSLLDEWHWLCLFFNRTFSSLLQSYICIEIMFLQHHHWRKDLRRASERRRLSKRISMNLKRKLFMTCDNSSNLLSIALMFLIYIAVRKYKRHIAEDKSMLLAMKNEVKNDVKQWKHEVK